MCLLIYDYSFCITIQLIFRDLSHNHIYITTDAGQSYVQRPINFRPNVVQFSYHEEDRLFVIDSSNNTVGHTSCCRSHTRYNRKGVKNKGSCLLSAVIIKLALLI